MSMITSIFIPGILGLGLTALNIFLTYETICWIPFSVSKRTGLCVLIWLVPVLGALIVAKQLKLLFSPKTAYSGGGGALIEMDAIFNPQARHYIEYKQEKSSIVLGNQQTDDSNKNSFAKSAMLKN